VPEVSVIIPTYNRRDFLPEAVSSCFEGNEGLSIEVVVVDDGSTDGTREWLRSRENDRIRPVFREHEGAQQARNAGLEAARGNTIKFLDSDDYLYPGVLEEQYETLTEVEADVCYGPIDIVEGDGNVRGHKPNPAVEDLLGGIATGTVTTYPHVFLYRADVARWAQWRPEVPFHQDTAYALDVAVHDPEVIRSEAAVGIHRAHSGTRITTTAKAKSSRENIAYKFDLLYRALQKHIQCTGGVTDEVRKKVAHGLWQETHKIGPVSFDRFLDCWEKIRDIAPNYYPERENVILKMLDRFLGVVKAEKIINPIRFLKSKFFHESI